MMPPVADTGMRREPSAGPRMSTAAGHSPASGAVAAERPRLRGRLHQLAFVGSIPALVWLVRSASTPRALVAAWVYGLASILLYFTSSTYHVFARSPRVRRIMRRADHSMIYVLIAGTFTPIALLGLRGSWRWPLLAMTWIGALAGVVLSMTALERYPRIGSALYLILGWGPAVALRDLAEQPKLLVMVALGGVLYTVGAVLFAMSRPRLSPRWFGFHEVWHTFGVVAGALLFVANLNLIRAG